MAYVLARVGQSLSNSFRHFVCDETADLEKLKEDVKDAPMGSTCYIIDDGAFYILNSKGEWKKGATQIVNHILGG